MRNKVFNHKAFCRCLAYCTYSAHNVPLPFYIYRFPRNSSVLHNHRDDFSHCIRPMWTWGLLQGARCADYLTRTFEFRRHTLRKEEAMLFNKTWEQIGFAKVFWTTDYFCRRFIHCHDMVRPRCFDFVVKIWIAIEWKPNKQHKSIGLPAFRVTERQCTNVVAVLLTLAF